MSVETAIKAIVVRSANDVAVAIAESVGGTESHFAEMMTAKARALGMREHVLSQRVGIARSTADHDGERSRHPGAPSRLRLSAILSLFRHAEFQLSRIDLLHARQSARAFRGHGRNKDRATPMHRASILYRRSCATARMSSASSWAAIPLVSATTRWCSCSRRPSRRFRPTPRSLRTATFPGSAPPLPRCRQRIAVCPGEPPAPVIFSIGAALNPVLAQQRRHRRRRGRGHYSDRCCARSPNCPAHPSNRRV